MSGNLAGLNFNPDEIEAPSDNYDVVPAGWYAAVITDSDYTANSKGNGHNLKLVLEITGPHQAGRKLFQHLALDNPNHEAVRIAGETLKKVCDAVQIHGGLVDSSLLHDKPFMINVGVKPRKDTGEPESVIKQFKVFDPARLTAPAAAQRPAAPAFGNAPTPPPASQAQTGQATAGTTNPPWGAK